MKKIPIRRIILAPKEQASSERFSIRRVQDLLDGKDLLQDLHRHDFFFILALQNGMGTHEIDFTLYEIYNHSVFFMRPGQVHQLRLKAGCTGYLMEFNNEFYHPTDKVSTQRLLKASNKNFCQVDVGRFEKLDAVLRYIDEENADKKEGFQEIIKANLDIFFIELVRQSNNPENPFTSISQYTQERLEEFLELLDKHITDRKQVSQYTELMNLSTYQLNEITKATIGKTPSELINARIILEAKRYLLATPNQIKDIADYLGYEDVSYFIRFFKKHTSYSPDTFRRVQ
ncbi:MAG: helix-turn-helix transcriptional regulator [Chitinophagaceae bacterium]